MTMFDLPRRPLVVLCALGASFLTGCGTTLMVDDGRKLDDKLVAEMKDYGSAVRVLRPAIVKSAALRDEDCSKQYELPFVAWTSDGIRSDDIKVAWLRAIGVNTDVSVLATDGTVALAPGDIITQVGGYSSSKSLKVFTELLELRDKGKPFTLKLRSGREVAVTPVEVCRGRVAPSLPLEAAVQSYHWTAVSHPHQLFAASLTPDEALWVVLWSQGLSEVGGARMKGYAFAVGAVKWTAVAAITVASGGAMAAAGGAAAAGGTSLGAMAGQMLAINAAGQVATGLASAAANRASLSGINGIAAGVFDKADGWAFEQARKIGIDPRAGLSLNDKLVRQGWAANAFALDQERLSKLQALVATLPVQASAVPAGESGPVAVETFRVPDPNDAAEEAQTGAGTAPL